MKRIEDERFLRGLGNFVANLNKENQAYAKVVRSTHGHAKLVSIDTSAALLSEGVRAVYTGKELLEDNLGPLPCTTQFSAVKPIVPADRYALAIEKVRHVGDPIALVIADTVEAAELAADVVYAEYEPLPVATTVSDAQNEGAPVIWESAPDNIAYRFEKGQKAEVNQVFSTAAYVAELEIVNNRVMAAPMEPRAGLGYFDEEEGTMHLTCTAQGVHAIREQLARDVFRIPEEKIQILAPDVGGGFGLKNFLFPEWVLLLWAARKTKRPIKWVAERSEDHSASLHGRDIITRARLALDREGRFLALEANLVANMGAYLSAGGPNASTNAASTAMGGVYQIPVIYMQSSGVFTNTTPIDAYRGAGKPEANFIIERLIDVAASRFGFDPVQLRISNVITYLPYETALGLKIDTGKFGDNIKKACDYIDRAGFVTRSKESAQSGFLRGLGFGCFLETSRGFPKEGAEITFTDKGRVELRVGTESNGQGHETTYIALAASRLGIPSSSFDYVQANTRKIKLGAGHGGARSMHMGAATMVLAIDEVLAKARCVAATLLQADPAKLLFSVGSFTTQHDGRSVNIQEVAVAARNKDVAPDLGGEGLDTFTLRENAPFTFPNGCHAAEVEIDPDTGSVTLLKYIMVDDYGALVNPALTEGQLHGGVAQGIGQALMEFVSFERQSGQLLSGSLMDYTLPRASALPNFDAHFEGTPTKANSLGVKGVGQAGCIAAPQVIMHAILNALEPLGIDHLQMPATSQTVWRSIQKAKNGS
ncbi:MAG: carbon monoxide dehydrogenase [Rhodospirillaceae bacterium]|nr:carbon monoxide dehydrogenase [Rhodospirillaceae bacterium]